MTYASTKRSYNNMMYRQPISTSKPVCDRWRESFDNFYLDMGERPAGGFGIALIDAAKPFSKENCHWAFINRHDVGGDRKIPFKKMTTEDVKELLRLVHEEGFHYSDMPTLFPIGRTYAYKIAYGKAARIPGYPYPKYIKPAKKSFYY